jgi:hypothetical protein
MINYLQSKNCIIISIIDIKITIILQLKTKFIIKFYFKKIKLNNFK